MAKAIIIGLGRSGIAAARVLRRDGWDVTLTDRAKNETLAALAAPLEGEGITVELGRTLSWETQDLPDRLIVSPGVPWDLPLLSQAREKGVEVMGELELAWRYLKQYPWVGVTGTNGKTTTTSLIQAIFETAGLQAPACGNIGYAACELVLENRHFDWIIAEISSYQIEASPTIAPEIGLWTTFTPDHLERHKTLENYYGIKASLLTRSKTQIFNGDDPYLRQRAPEEYPEAYWTSVEGPETLPCPLNRAAYLQDAWVGAFGELLLPVHLFRMVGRHNQQNLLMASAAARLAGIDKKAITQTLLTFNGVAHRLEKICSIQGVEFINDSKATNYDAAEVGLASVTAPAILIAGGEAKAGEDRAWLAQIQTRAAQVLLIGAAAPAFAQRLREIGYENYEIMETMERAVPRGLESALALGARCVLLSPACASFDQYKSFEERGEDFRRRCLELAG